MRVGTTAMLGYRPATCVGIWQWHGNAGRGRKHLPLCEKDAAVARGESVALPLVQVVVILQPLVQLLANEVLHHSSMSA